MAAANYCRVCISYIFFTALPPNQWRVISVGRTFFFFFVWVQQYGTFEKDSGTLFVSTTNTRRASVRPFVGQETPLNRRCPPAPSTIKVFFYLRSLVWRPLAAGGAKCWAPHWAFCFISAICEYLCWTEPAIKITEPALLCLTSPHTRAEQQTPKIFRARWAPARAQRMPICQKFNSVLSYCDKGAPQPGHVCLSWSVFCERDFFSFF